MKYGVTTSEALLAPRKQPESKSACTVSSTCSGPLGTSCASDASSGGRGYAAGARRSIADAPRRVRPVLLELLAGARRDLAGQIEAEVVPRLDAPVGIALEVLGGEVAAAAPEPHRRRRRPSCGGCAGWRGRAGSSGRAARTSPPRRPARAAIRTSRRPPSHAPMPSIRRRTRTPCSAFVRSAAAISSPSRSRARMKVQTSSDFVALPITVEHGAARVGAVGVDAQRFVGRGGSQAHRAAEATCPERRRLVVVGGCRRDRRQHGQRRACAACGCRTSGRAAARRTAGARARRPRRSPPTGRAAAAASAQQRRR